MSVQDVDIHLLLTAVAMQPVQGELSSPTIAALELLAALFGLSLIEKQAGDFLEDSYLSGEAGNAGLSHTVLYVAAIVTCPACIIL